MAMADPQVQDIHLTADIDDQVHILNDSWKDIAYYIHQIRLVCSSFQCRLLFHKTRIHSILRLALELAASLQAFVLVYEAEEYSLLVSIVIIDKISNLSDTS